MKLKSISIEYEDGNTQRIEAPGLDGRVQAALTAAGFCDPAPEVASARHYLILEWRDGWKEVLAVDGAAVNLIRYYIIRRIEDTGRIALDTGAGYPQLIVLNRLPCDLSRIWLVGERDLKTYQLQSEIESYEGTFDAGGKKEFKKYDRDNPAFKEAFSQNAENLTEIRNSVLQAVSQRGLRPADLLRLDDGPRRQEYAQIARAAGLLGFEKQGDVYGLIDRLLQDSTVQH